jgi:putative spermidine/putrescine transport system permease protein
MKARVGGLAIPTGTLLVMLYLLFPVVVVVLISFSSARFLSFPPPGYSIQWYAKLLADPDWLNSLTVTLQVGALTTVFSTLLGVPAAFALSRYGIPGRSFVTALILASLITPTIIKGLSLYLFYVPLGLVNTVWGLAAAHTVSGLPYVVINTIASLRSADRDLERAAVIHGASPLWAVMRITLPIISPGIMVGAVFAFIQSVHELLVALFVLGGVEKPLAVKLWAGVRAEVDPTIAAVSTGLIGMAVLAYACAGAAQLLSKRRGAAVAGP